MKYIKINLLLIATAISLLTSCSTDSGIDYNTNTGNESIYVDNSNTGVGGSMARFAIAGNFMYTVDMQKLNVFSITDEKKPELKNELHLNWGVETIFAKPPYLFLGTRTGVEIIDISDPENPTYRSKFEHIYSCDPVVVSGNIAYSTLNSTGPCGRGLNQLDIIDISDINNPRWVNTIQLTNPRGLGISGNILFVCNDGIEVYDISGEFKTNPKLIEKNTSVPAIDVIPLDTLLLIGAEDGLHQYSFNQDFDFEFLSTLYSVE